MTTNALQLHWDAGKVDVQRKLSEFVQYFQTSLPRNSKGIPMQLIDPTVILQAIVHAEVTDDIDSDTLRQAVLNIEFEEGYPTVDGLPIWERLDGELVDYYKLFKEYREMKGLSGSRSLAKLSDSCGMSGVHLSYLSRIYHWQLRCIAFDHQKEVEKDCYRQQQIRDLENTHVEAAATLLQDAMDYFKKHPEQLNPKIAIQMVQTSVKVGRLALGLGGEKTASSPTHINIQQNTHADADVLTQVNSVNTASPNKEDLTHLQSILHVLDSSGAFRETTRPSEVIELDPEESDEDTI